MHWDGWWHMEWMWIFWIILIVALVFLVRWLAGSTPGGGGPRETPEEILKKRYARGEIDREEYEKRLNDLRR